MGTRARLLGVVVTHVHDAGVTFIIQLEAMQASTACRCSGDTMRHVLFRTFCLAGPGAGLGANSFRFVLVQTDLLAAQHVVSVAYVHAAVTVSTRLEAAITIAAGCFTVRAGRFV